MRNLSIDGPLAGIAGGSSALLPSTASSKRLSYSSTARLLGTTRQQAGKVNCRRSRAFLSSQDTQTPRCGSLVRAAVKGGGKVDHLDGLTA